MSDKEFLIMRTREDILTKVCEICGIKREDKSSGYLTREEAAELLQWVMKRSDTQAEEQTS